MVFSTDLREMVREKRNLAERAFRLAQTLSSNDDRQMLLAYSAEKELEAAALEHQLAPASATATHTQQQQQQSPTCVLTLTH